MISLIMIGYTLTVPMIASATLVPFTESNCSDLAKPKTVLLVRATWCSHCKKFLPVYEKVSNKDKYKDWTFYNIIADDLWRVCGKQIDGYPYTYKNNMKTVLKGNRSQKALEHFLDAN
ncbi:MAG: protein disulfide isomerase family protein [Gammaproteobacteria bacterium]|nr:protein disulfide isomerase family protein [Gammaproteobacteria bacterium]